MAVDLGSAYIQILPSLRGAAGTINRELSGIGQSAGSRSGGLFAGAFTKALAPLAALTAGAIGAAAVAGFLKDSISSASDLEQSLGGVDAIFGKSAKQINKWAKAAQNSVGLSQNAYNELANVLGSQLKNSGTAIDKVGKKTNKLIKVGADLAATFGGSTADAVEAISSALKGERDPIEKYGVSLNQTAVDAKAAELGFKKVGGTLSVQASQAATLALIYKQTSAATGQFGKQSDTLAEKQQVFNATLENVKAKVGNAFLPAISDMVGALSKVLDPALEAIKPGLDGFAGFVSDTAGKVSKSFTDLVSGKALGNTSGLTTALQPIIDKLKKIPDEAGTSFDSIAKSLKKALPDMLTFAKDVGPQFVQILSDAVVLTGRLAPAIAALSPVLVPLGAALGALLKLSPVSMLRDMFDFMDSAQEPAQKLQSALAGTYGPFAQFSANIGLAMETAKGKISEFVIGAQIKFAKFKYDAISAVVGFVLGFQEKMREFVLSGVLAVAKFIHSFADFKARIGTIAATAGRILVEQFVSGIRSRIDAVGAAVGAVMAKAKQFFPHSPAKRGPFSGAGWRQVGTSGTALAAQFTGGFNAGIRDFASTVGGVVPDTISSSVAGTITNTSKAPSTSVLIANKTNVRLEDLVDVRIAKSDQEAARAQRLGYQPLVFG